MAEQSEDVARKAPAGSPDSHGSAAAEKPITIYAWIGEDELGSGVTGLKQGQTPAGIIPLAAMGHHLDRLAKLMPVMEEQAKTYGKKIRLCKFEMVEVAAETRAGEAAPSPQVVQPKKKTHVRLYRFLNVESSKYGEPFALCDACKPEYKVPSYCWIDKIADRALWACTLCGVENGR